MEKQSATPSYLVRMGTTSLPVSKLSMMLLVPWEKVMVRAGTGNDFSSKVPTVPYLQALIYQYLQVQLVRDNNI